MKDNSHARQRKTCTVLLAAFLGMYTVPSAGGYAFDEVVPDVRQPVALSGGSACPVRAHQLSSAGSIAVRWSTALGTSPITILTQDQTANGQLAEIEQVITQSLAVWIGVTGTTLAPSSLAPLTRVSTANACSSDGVNSICFDQADGAFTPGVLAFTRVITADTIGVQIGSGAPATQVGQILDADIYFDPSDSTITFATPAALAANPHAYDLESLLTHEFGHLPRVQPLRGMERDDVSVRARARHIHRRAPADAATGCAAERRRPHRVAGALSFAVGHCECRIDSRAHSACQSFVAARLASGGYRRVWGACCCGGRGERLGGRRPPSAAGAAWILGRRNSTGATRSTGFRWGTTTRSTPNHWTEWWHRRRSRRRWCHYAAIPPPMRVGRRCRVASCLFRTPASRCGPGLGRRVGFQILPRNSSRRLIRNWPLLLPRWSRAGCRR